MRFSYLVDELDGDPFVGRIYALPMEATEGEDAFELDLRDDTAAPGWTPWFVDIPHTATTISEEEVGSLAGAAGLPPGAEAA